MLVSHHIADVLSVADRVVVLRLGRNAGEFRAAETTSEAIIAAIGSAGFVLMISFMVADITFSQSC